MRSFTLALALSLCATGAWAQASPAVNLAAARTPPPAAHAPDAPKSVQSAQRTLLDWFAGYELVPTAADFERLGAPLGPALLRIAEAAPDPRVQARAVSALVYAPTPLTEAWLVARLRAADRPSLLLRKVALVLGESYGARHLDLFAYALGQARADVPLREALARALLSAGEQGRPLRRWVLRFEAAPTVRALLAQKRVGQPR